MEQQITQTDWPIQIHEWIEDRRFGQLKHALADMEIHDLADVLMHLPEKDWAIAFRMLPTDRAAEILSEFEPDMREQLVNSLSSEAVAGIINEMYPDDRTELLEELPGTLAQELLNHLAGNELKIARSLLAYPEDSIGRLMTPEYVAVRSDWTIEQVLRQIRRKASDIETFQVIYVVDDRWTLLDEIYLEDVILAEPDQLVSELMDNQFASLHARDDQESAVEMFKKYNAVALPVVDSRGTLVGIVTFDDVMDVQEEESTEDIQKMAGMEPLSYSYFGASWSKMLKSRLPWLMMLLAVETSAVLVLRGFEELLAVLAMFMPLINATAGNTGSQVSGLMIRGMAVMEIDIADWWRVLLREISRGLVMGLILSIMAIGIVLLFGRSTGTALAVGIAMVAAVTLANLLGAMLPFVFRRIGMDPAVTSGPFIACLMDVSSILIFFSIASSIMHIL